MNPCNPYQRPLFPHSRSLRWWAGLAAVLLAAPAWAAGPSDDFNRPNSTNLGPDWTETRGDLEILGNAVRSTGGYQDTKVMIHQQAVAAATVEVTADVSAQGTSLQYAGLVSRYANASQSIFVKVQQNSGSTQFERAYFYLGDNGLGGNFGGVSTPVTPFTSARIRTVTTETTCTLYIDTDFDGTPEQTYGPYTIPATGGNQVGIAAFGTASIDNFAAGAPAPLAEAIVSKGDAVPQAGVDSRIQAGALFTSFGLPATNDAGSVAYVGKWNAPATKVPKVAAQNGAGIFVDGALVVKVGEDVPGLPGAKFKVFKDPLIDANGNLACIAALTGAGVNASNDSVVIVVPTGGEPIIAAREGAEAPGSDGATFKVFTSVSIQAQSGAVAMSLPAEGGATAGVVLTASLTKDSGTPVVTTLTDTGAWILPPFGSLVKVVREGDAFGATTIKSFVLLKTIGGSPDQGRGHFSATIGSVKLALNDKREVLANYGSGVLVEVTGTGTLLGGSTLPEAKWAKLNLPSHGQGGSAQTLFGALQPNVGGIISAEAKGIFQSTNIGGSWNPLVRVGEATDVIFPGSKFSVLKDPVNASDSLGVAFAATSKGTGLLPTKDQALWWIPSEGDLTLVAQEGAQPPGATGAQFKAFSSLALPGGSTGPIFTASLVKGPGTTAGPGGITAIDDFGLYGVTSSGNLVELMRENRPLLSKTVKSFVALRSAPGSAGTTRSFNSLGQIVSRVAFTDKSTAIVRFNLE